jgi:hypothetical protein
MEVKLKESWDELPTSFSTSAVKKTGREEILDFIHFVMHEKITNN